VHGGAESREVQIRVVIALKSSSNSRRLLVCLGILRDLEKEERHTNAKTQRSSKEKLVMLWV
jgi:hypothetical protein